MTLPGTARLARVALPVAATLTAAAVLTTALVQDVTRQAGELLGVWLPVEGDAVVFRPEPGQDTAAAPPPSTDPAAPVAGADGPGWSRLGAARAHPARLVARVVSGPHAAELEADLQRTLVALRPHLRFPLEQGERLPRDGQSVGTLTVTYAAPADNPCGAQAAGCGGPILDEDGRVIGGNVWICQDCRSAGTRPDVWTAGNVDHLIGHEVGHALGLGHYEPEHAGAFQLMHPTYYISTTAQSGDAAGLAALGSASPATPTSEPVPQQPTPGPTRAPVASGLVDDTDPAWTFTGAWLTQRQTRSGDVDRSVSYADQPAAAQLRFTGTRVQLLARRSVGSGLVRITLDRRKSVLVDLYGPGPGIKARQAVWTSPPLKRGRHTITIEWTGQRRPEARATTITLDALSITG